MEEVEGRRIRRFVPQRLSRRRLLPLHTIATTKSPHLTYLYFSWVADTPGFSKYGSQLGLALASLRYLEFLCTEHVQILLWELARTLQLLGGGIKLGNFASTWLFGLPPLVPGLSLSLADVGYACVSTIISVSVHEFGHAVAATSSEGIQIEYIAIFIAILFPGALVAYELFQTVPYWTGLRVYSAGIWHNAVVS
ncbi:Membrane-bound transcription factor site-2 protease-like protein [Vigna angularis]|uniref:Membrane-bound transcription factor site-2 protease-like protein n=1 Tax=Phaseolus angularis TaxID=3914 RepID=A0A8T0LA61_PHAAN|nr:Membrane-bound transcription factor site-2 protease-like protein [Vigna angularis]